MTRSELNAQLLQALGLSPGATQIVLERIQELESDLEKAQKRIKELEAASHQRFPVIVTDYRKDPPEETKYTNTFFS